MPIAKRFQLIGLLAVGACVGAATDHERLGDRAYAAGQFTDALIEYRVALARDESSGRLRAKAGAAALRGLDLQAAAQEYTALGTVGGSDRVDEAADGLVRVANAAIEEGNQEALALALDGLNRVAPGRALGSFAVPLATLVGSAPLNEEGLALVTFAAAGATNAGTQDSLMLVYASTLRRLGRCGDAAVVYESLVRRERDRAVATQARLELTVCSLDRGRRAFAAGDYVDAEMWFQRAVGGPGTVVGDTPAMRAAYVGLGDVRLAQGDFVGAVEAYARAMDGLQPGDSLYDTAARKLNSVGNAGRGIP